MIRSGEIPDEPDLFDALYVFDTFIEPTSTHIQQLRFAVLCDLILKSSGNVSESAFKNASYEDWDFYNILKSKEEKQKDKKKSEVEAFKKLMGGK